MTDQLAAIKARRAASKTGDLLTYTIAVLRDTPSDIDWLISEVERLTHLHALDHSLADQWQARNELLRQELDKEHELVQESCGCVSCGLDHVD